MNCRLELFIGGARGSRPVCGTRFQEFGGATVCYAIRLEDYAIVIDCGSGLYNLGHILSGCKQIDVLLTHVHYDHIIGLLDYGVFPGNISVRFIANFDSWYGKKTLKRFLQPPFWPHTPCFGALEAVHPPERFPLHLGCSAEFIPANHPNNAALIQLNIGGRRICFACDYEHGEPPLDDWVRGCDLLIYDGMYSQSEYLDHVGWGHSSWEQGCLLARRNEVSCLLISHHGPERDDEVLRREERQAQALFAQTRFARQGQSLIL